MFIGVKLIMTYLHEKFHSVPKVPTGIGLGVISAIIAISVIASLIKSNFDKSVVAHAGRVTGSKEP
jgi:tellurite resistance protein TerC